MSKKAFSHDRVEAGKDEWLTPPAMVDALGPFDLDPCSPVDRPWATAEKHFTIDDDGLAQDWGDSFVWMNPPYGRHTSVWLERLAEHGHGIALIFARTDTKAWTNQVWGRADAILFCDARITFFNRDGTAAKANAGAPSAFVAYGAEAAERLKTAWMCGLLSGALVEGWDV